MSAFASGEVCSSVVVVVGVVGARDLEYEDDFVFVSSASDCALGSVLGQRV